SHFVQHLLSRGQIICQQWTATTVARVFPLVSDHCRSLQSPAAAVLFIDAAASNFLNVQLAIVSNIWPSQVKCARCLLRPASQFSRTLLHGDRPPPLSDSLNPPEHLF